VADDDLQSLSERLLALTQKVEADEDVQALAKQVLALTGKVEAVETRMVVVERWKRSWRSQPSKRHVHWRRSSPLGRRRNRAPAGERGRINGGGNLQL
jgi:hypothetical protein